MKRLLFPIFFLLSVLLIFCLASCGGTDAPGTGTTANEETTAPAEEVKKIEIVSNGKSDYRIVDMGQYDASYAGKLYEIRDTIEELTGCFLGTSNGNLKPEESGKEIVLAFRKGLTTADYFKNGGLNDYVITTVGNTIVIGGYNRLSILEAADLFIDLLRKSADGNNLIIDAPDIHGTASVFASVEKREKVNVCDNFAFSYYLGPNADAIVENEDILVKMKEAGITRVEIDGTNIENVQKAIELCDKYGLEVKLFIRILTHVCVWQDRDETDEERALVIDDRVKKYVDYYAGYDNVKEWFICDEPGEERMKYVRWMMEAFRKYAPDLPLTLNFICGNVTPDSSYLPLIEGTLDSMEYDILSYDRYPFRHSGSELKPILYDDPYYFENMVYIKQEAQLRGLSAAFIVQQYLPKSTEQIKHSIEEAQFRWETNMALAHGYQNISYFTYSYFADKQGWVSGVVDENNEITDDYYELLNGIKGLFPYGQYLYDKQFDMVYHVNTGETLSAPAYLPYGGLGEITTEDKAVLGFFTDDHGGKICYFVNYDMTSDGGISTYSLNDLNGAELEVFDPADGTWKPAETSENIAKNAEGGYEISLIPGAAELLRVLELRLTESN